MAPVVTSWYDFAYDGTHWEDWNDLGLCEPTCPKIQVDNCGVGSPQSPVSYWDTEPLPTIVVYNNTDNVNVLRLLNKTDFVHLDNVTKIELRLDTGVVISSDDPFDTPGANLRLVPRVPISWATGYGREGSVYLRLGILGIIETKIYTADMVIFDPNNPEGLFWGAFRMRGIGHG